MRNGIKHFYQAPKIESPSDPTGAGDVFFAAYIAARYADKKDIADACRYAARIAARQVAGKYIAPETLRSGMKTEDRGRRTEGRRQRTEGRKQKS